MTAFCVLAELLALAGYLAAAVLYPLRLFRGDEGSARLAHRALVFASVLQGLGLLAHAGRSGGEVIFGQYANVTYVFVLFMVAALILLDKRLERPAVAAFLAPILFLLVVLTLFRRELTWPLVRDPWFIAHILLTLTSYACFAVAFVMAAAYLLQDWWLKHKRLGRIQLLPALQVADSTAHLAAAIGHSLLTLGLLVGIAVLVSKGLAIDGKVVLSTVIWSLYAGYLLLRHTTGWRGRRMQVMLIVGFVLVMVNFVSARHSASIHLTATAETAPGGS